MDIDVAIEIIGSYLADHSKTQITFFDDPKTHSIWMYANGAINEILFLLEREAEKIPSYITDSDSEIFDPKEILSNYISKKESDFYNGGEKIESLNVSAKVAKEILEIMKNKERRHL